MAVYRRGWNGLTCLNPEVDTFPETMELKVFPVPRTVEKSIKVEVMPRKSHRNKVLIGVTVVAAIAYLAAACTMQRPTIAAGIVVGISLAWMALFAIANRRR